MAEKTLNTRIVLKHDTLENWNSDSAVVLKKGEIALASITVAKPTTKGEVPVPTYLMKVGDGSSKFSELEWVSATAADVYDWAKKAKPDYNDLINKPTIPTLPTHIVNSIKATGDNEISMTPGQSESGNVTITAAHTKHKEASANTSSDTIISGYGDSGKLKIPKIKTNAAGHVTELTEETVNITMPEAQLIPTVNDGKFTVSGDDGIKGTGYGTANQANNTTATLSIDWTKVAKKSDIPSVTITPDAVEDSQSSEDSVTVLSNLTASGHTITKYKVTVPTTEYVDNKVAGSVQYLGLASKMTDLSVTAGKGDFYRASSSFTEEPPSSKKTSSGDLLVALQDNPEQNFSESGYAIVKSSDDYKGTVTSVGATGDDIIEISGSPIVEEGTIGITHSAGSAANKAAGFYKIATDAHSHVKSVTTVGKTDITNTLGYIPYDSTNPNGYTTNTGTVTSITVNGTNGLTGTGTVTSKGTINISHDNTSEQPSVNNSGRTYIQDVTLDKYGHVTGLTSATETVVDTNTAHTHSAGECLAIEGNGGISGNVKYSHAKIASPTPSTGSGRTYLTDVTTDGYGHITGYKTSTETVTNTGHSHAAGTGITVKTTSGNGTTSGVVTIGIDEEITFILNGGTSTTVI